MFFIGAETTREAVQLIENPPKTGVKYSNLPNRSSAPDEAPAKQSGDLADSMGFQMQGAFKVQVGATAVSDAGAPYPLFLEDGTSKMAPRPFLLKAVNNKARDFERALYREFI